MFSKTALFCAFVAIAEFATATSPPACLLGVVNTYDKAYDISSVCKSTSLNADVSKACGDDTKAALASLADTCNTAGVKISTDVPSTASGSSKPTGSAGSASASAGYAAASGASVVSGSPSGTAGATTFAYSTGTPTPTASGPGSQKTGAAGKLEVGFAAIVLGAVAAAL